jgi:hypothetical protein
MRRSCAVIEHGSVPRQEIRRQPCRPQTAVSAATAEAHGFGRIAYPTYASRMNPIFADAAAPISAHDAFASPRYVQSRSSVANGRSSNRAVPSETVATIRTRRFYARTQSAALRFVRRRHTGAQRCTDRPTDRRDGCITAQLSLWEGAQGLPLRLCTCLPAPMSVGERSSTSADTSACEFIASFASAYLLACALTLLRAAEDAV